MKGPKRQEALEVWRATWLLRGMDEPEPSVSFTHLGLNPTLVRAAERAGYTEPSAVQVAVVPAVLAGRDLRVRAETGSGKTAAFALPLLQLLLEQQSARSTERTETKHERRGNPVAVLVLVPTRELAIQIADVMTRLNGETTARLRILAVYGGVSANPQMLSLRGGADVLVATPGRLLDLHRQGAVSFGTLGTLVVDEADRMLSLGFHDELTEITTLLPAARQNLLLSATYPRKLSALTESLLKDPVIVDLAPTVTETAIAQHAYVVDPKHKVKLLIHLIDLQQLPQVLVFVSAKKTADALRKELNGADMPAAVLHGDRSQSERARCLDAFRRGALRVLIATDLAARGIDIEDLPAVINFELPRSPNDYTHRIGRTGRAGKRGVAISLLCPEDEQHFRVIEKRIKRRLPREQVAGFEMAPTPGKR